MIRVLPLLLRSAGRQAVTVGPCLPVVTAASPDSRPQVESATVPVSGGTAHGRPLTDRRPLSYGDEPHLGSADLDRFPASGAELEAAATGAFRDLYDICGSFPRARAVMDEVERPQREARAEQLLARIT